MVCRVYVVEPILDRKYTEDYIINMLEFLVDNIFAVFGGGGIFSPQKVGITIDTNCAPYLADILKRNSYRLCSRLKRNS